MKKFSSPPSKVPPAWHRPLLALPHIFSPSTGVALKKNPNLYDDLSDETAQATVCNCGGLGVGQKLIANIGVQQMLLIFGLMLLATFGVQAQDVSPATVTTDKDDYAPRSNAVFTGSGFAAYENVVLKVKNLSKPCNTVSADSSYLPFSVVTDANGGFVTNWTVCDCPGDSLQLKATGQISEMVAYAYFTDGPTLTKVVVGQQSNNVVSGTSGSVTFPVTVTRAGSNGNLNVNICLSSSTLPSGIVNSFTNANILNGSSTSSPTLTLNYSAVPAGTYSFVIRAYLSGGSRSCSNPGSDYEEITGTFVVATVCTTPSISSQPGSQTKTYGDNAVFTVSTSGTTPTTYKWQISKNNGVSFTDVSDETFTGYSGASSAALTVTKPTVAMSGYKYRVILSACSPVQSTTSNGEATLTVNTRQLTPTITVADKTYDGTALATITERSLANTVDTDEVSLGTSGTATFVDSDAGEGKTVTITGLSLSGASAANYSLASTVATATAT
uniref:YDG domain-containing protein n=1 Tax=Pontibacter beigongshangensis TaxID=2574733 RepID=UPI00164FAF52